MDILSSHENIEQLDMIIQSLEVNEDVYYIALDLLYQAREEISRVSFEEDDEQ